MFASIRPFQNTIRKTILERTKKQKRLLHYNSLVNVLAMHKIVSFNGQVYRSMADLTIDFFNAHKSSAELQEASHD